jgi:hypothetical protein
VPSRSAGYVGRNGIRYGGPETVFRPYADLFKIVYLVADGYKISA